jgi:acetyl-CoA carboxylase biotin carboxyl carrier protein
LSEASENPRPFDVQTIESLVRLMTENDISEIDLAWGDERIRLRRGPRVSAATVPAAAPAPAVPPSPAVPAAAPTEKSGKKLHEITSPTVGTFYHQRQPGDPPLVTVGSRVTRTTPVGVITAMKVNNEILAECDGVIVEVCAKNDEFVDYGTVLFRVDLS